MNTLWIFGDSFSWDYKLREKNEPDTLTDDQDWNYIQTHLKGKIFDSWGEQLSNNLGYEYINHGCFQSGIEIPNIEAGNSNNCNINLINELSSEFKKGDILIFGFTDPIRFPPIAPSRVARFQKTKTPMPVNQKPRSRSLYSCCEALTAFDSSIVSCALSRRSNPFGSNSGFMRSA